eukprot:364606-Chlamydomonas_euryale.AAC.4
MVPPCRTYAFGPHACMRRTGYVQLLASLRARGNGNPLHTYAIARMHACGQGERRASNVGPCMRVACMPVHACVRFQHSQACEVCILMRRRTKSSSSARSKHRMTALALRPGAPVHDARDVERGTKTSLTLSATPTLAHAHPRLVRSLSLRTYLWLMHTRGGSAPCRSEPISGSCTPEDPNDSVRGRRNSRRAWAVVHERDLAKAFAALLAVHPNLHGTPLLQNLQHACIGRRACSQPPVACTPCANMKELLACMHACMLALLLAFRVPI